MNKAVTIRIEDFATPALARKAAAMTPQAITAAAGEPVMDLCRTNLAALGTNQKGWPSQRFHEKFADSCKLVELDNGFAVVIGPIQMHGRLVGLRGLLYTHIITPQEVDNLAIPIDEQSYGKVPSDFTGQGLFLMPTPKGAYLCIKAGKDKNAPVIFLFKLAKYVAQRGRPELLPTEAEIQIIVRRALAQQWNQN